MSAVIDEIRRRLEQGFQVVKIGRAAYKPDIPESHYVVLAAPEDTTLHLQLIDQQDLDYVEAILNAREGQAGTE